MAVPIITSVDNALPAISLAFRSLPAPSSSLELDAPPIQRSSAAAGEMGVTGNAMLVAAFTSVPTT